MNIGAMASRGSVCHELSTAIYLNLLIYKPATHPPTYYILIVLEILGYLIITVSGFK